MITNERINKLTKAQWDFQLLAEKPVDSIQEKVRNSLAEEYILKLIEESIEVRKEFPSAFNPWSKTQKVADIKRIKEEMSDVFLFFVNLLNVWRIDFEDFLNEVEEIQDNNFKGLKGKKLAIVNQKVMNTPTHTSCIGHGNPNPKFIIVGLNPGSDIEHGYKCWSNPEDGSSRILLPILEELDILKDCYFTNLVKSTTLNNEEPSEDDVKFWSNLLKEELDILKTNNPDAKIVGLGKFVDSHIKVDISIPHPAYVYHGGMSLLDYKDVITQWIKK